VLNEILPSWCFLTVDDLMNIIFYIITVHTNSAYINPNKFDFRGSGAGHS